CMRCGVELFLVVTVALLPLVFTRVPLFLIVEFTLDCLAAAFEELLKSERTLVEVLTAFPLEETVFPVARVAVARLSPFCLILLLVVALPALSNRLLLCLTAPFT